MIPTQLQRGDFRFIKVKDSKAPLEDDWTGKNNYAHNDIELDKFIKANNKYGVLCGIGGLIVIDFDSQLIQDELMEKLPPTFTIKSAGRGLYHLYYLTDTPESFKILDINKNTLVDIQGKGRQVIGANSIMNNNKKYEIVKDIPLTTIPYPELKICFSKYLNIESDIKKREKEEIDYECKQIKERIKIPDLLRDFNIDILKNPTGCPLHTSKGGKCLSFTDDVYYCFHCESKGNIFHLYMAKNSCDFVKAKKALAERAGVKLIKRLSLNGLYIDDYTYNVEVFYNQHPFFYDKNQNFWFWNKEECKYEIWDDIDVMIALDDLLGFEGKTVNMRVKNQYLEAFKRVGRKHIPKNAPLKWIQFRNKAFSLKSGQLYDVTPDFFFTNPIPYDIGSSSYCPMIDQLFTDWVGEKFKPTLYELVAYCCYSGYPIQTLFCLFGSGRNGKSCFTRMLIKYLGESNTSSTELDRLFGMQSSRFESIKVYKKLACFMGETNFGTISQSSILKKLTGGDLIGFEMKNKKPFDDYSFAKIIIASNSLPRTEDTSDGFWRRWLIIDFPNEFKEGQDVVCKIPECEYNALAKKCIEILPGLLEKGEFTNQGTIIQRKDRYVMASNPLPSFIERFCYYDATVFMRKNELYMSYVHYLSGLKRRIVSRKEFNVLLEQEGIDYRYTQKKICDEWCYDTYIEGMALRDLKQSEHVGNVANVKSFTPQLSRIGGGGGKHLTFPTFATYLQPKKVCEEIIEDNSILKFDIKCLAHIPCGYPIGDDICGNMPCNEYNGLYYCEKHFEMAQDNKHSKG